MGELFDEGGSESKFLLIGSVFDFMTMPPANEEAIVQFDPNLLEPRLANVHAAHRQRIGKGVEKGGGIGRTNLDHRIGRRLAIVEINPNRMEEADESAARAVQRFDQPPIHPMARFLKALGIEQADHVVEFLGHLPVVPFRQGSAGHRLNMKEIDNLLSGQAGLAGRARAQGTCIASRRRRRDRFGGSEDAPFPDIEAEGRQQSADHRKLGEVIVGDDEEIGRSVRPLIQCHLGRMIGIEPRRQSEMTRHVGRGKFREILVIHARKESRG